MCIRDRFSDIKYAEYSFTKGPNFLESSPISGASTLITRAPRSDKIIVQYGPTKTLVRSTTNKFFKGPSIIISMSFPYIDSYSQVQFNIIIINKKGKTMLRKITLYLSSIIIAFSIVGSAYAVTLKASHQWPGTPRADGSFDPRHEMVQIIADEVKKANVDLEIRIYPAKSLYKPKEQWKPMTTGQLDISAFPLAYASKFHPEFDATLMPGTVKNHEHALRFNKGPMMTEIKKIISDAGVVVLSDAWLGGGFASKTKCIKNPSDAKGQVMRAAGKAFNQMLEAAGAGIQSMPSSEIYTGLQTGVLTGANTSSGSFVSYKIYEQVSCATPPGKFGLWFMYEPILMSKKSYDALSSKQQKALMKAGKVAEKYMTAQVENLDKKFEEAYKAAGVKLVYMDANDHAAWVEIAKKSSHKAFAEKVPGGDKLMEMALAVK